MALLSLKDIGKIYVSENSVAVGIRGINLDFDLGEFVAITGKSGAGKSTLLNVISGIDTYEEGEMYVNGEATSHYIQSDWEEYRKKYISFIFQDYNIIDSFTVLENVELALINITDHKERRKKALELIDRVGLTSHIKSKGSKLSGGQKQRTVIARALAKDSPIILADEPTGNLDSKSGKEIIQLLKEVSNNKLVIVVTHNFDDFSEYATRHVRIFDGGVESDDVLSRSEVTEYKEIDKVNTKASFKENFKDGAFLGFSVFKARPKLTSFMIFLMLIGTLAIFFATASLSSGFEIFKKPYMFTPSNGRVVIAKYDSSSISENELNELNNNYDLDGYIHYDYLLDNKNSFTREYNYDYLSLNIVINKDYGNNIIGRYPENINECLLYLPISYKTMFGNTLNENETIYFNKIPIKVVGIKYFTDNTLDSEALVTIEGLKYLTGIYFLEDANIEIDLLLDDGKEQFIIELNKLYPSVSIDKDKYYINSSKVSSFEDDNGFQLISLYGDIKMTRYYFSYYFENNKTYDAEFTYSKDKRVYEIGEDLENNAIYLGIDLYNELIDSLLKDNYSQASLYFKNNNVAKSNIKKLNDDGYIAVMSNTKYSPSALDTIFGLIGSIFSLIGWIISIIFIGLFINLCTRKSLESFKHDIGIMRSMGITEKIIKIANYFRIFICLIPAFLITYIGAFILFSIPYTNSMFTYLHFWQYILIFIGMIFLAYRVSHRQNKRIFKESVKKSIKEGENHD